MSNTKLTWKQHMLLPTAAENLAKGQDIKTIAKGMGFSVSTLRNEMGPLLRDDQLLALM
jgi:hypothetical protein